MKTKILKIALLVPALLFCVSIQAQNEEIPIDIDFLDPHDHLGNKWFEDIQDRRDFFNALATAVKTDPDRPLISITEDVFIATVRSDDDHEHDNKNYHHLFTFKSDSPQEVFNDLDHSYTDPHLYDLKFYIGQNMTYSKFTSDLEFVHLFAEDGAYVSRNLEAEFSAFPEEGYYTGSWAYGLEGDLYGRMNSLTIEGN